MTPAPRRELKLAERYFNISLGVLLVFFLAVIAMSCIDAVKINELQGQHNFEALDEAGKLIDKGDTYIGLMLWGIFFWMGSNVIVKVWARESTTQPHPQKGECV